MKTTTETIALPEILFSELNDIGAVLDDPKKAFGGFVRTKDECRRAVKSLVNLMRCQKFDSSWIESLILALHRSDFESCNAVAENYVAGPAGLDHARARAFKFLLNATVDDTKRSQSSVLHTPYLPFLWGWDSHVINEAVRRYPWLYWCHPRYSEGISKALSDFYSPYKEKCYTEREWNRIERAIRRIVQAEDGKLVGFIQGIHRLHQEGKMGVEEGSDWFLPYHILGCLSGASDKLCALPKVEIGQVQGKAISILSSESKE